MLNLKMTDAQLWAAWANMLLCSDATSQALGTAKVADSEPLAGTLLIAMNLATDELDEIAAELNARGLKIRRASDGAAGTYH